METTPVFTPDQLMTSAVIADPYPAYRQLRDQSPFNFVAVPSGVVPGIDEPMRAWALMKHADVYGALRDHNRFSSQDPLLRKIPPKLVFISDDPPRHTRFRRLVNKTFTLRRIATLEPWITSIATELLDTMGEGEIDVVPSYTSPLPVRVIARLLGIPEEDYITFRRWSDACFSTFTMPAEQRTKNIQDMTAYFGQMASARRTQSADDLITALVEAEDEGESLQEWEIVGFCILLLIAGNETTTNLLGNMLNILVDRPELWQQLRDDRGLVDTVIEETLRYESPVQRLRRVTTQEVEISGVKIPQGDLVAIFYGAANRDPSAFANPDEFRLDRNLRDHVAFGMGIHYCLGAPLARTEAKIMLNAFLDRFPLIKRGGTPGVRQTGTSVMFGFRKLPLKLSARGK
jgi:cytochrome P450